MISLTLILIWHNCKDERTKPLKRQRPRSAIGFGAKVSVLRQADVLFKMKGKDLQLYTDIVKLNDDEKMQWILQCVSCHRDIWVSPQAERNAEITAMVPFYETEIIRLTTSPICQIRFKIFLVFSY